MATDHHLAGRALGVATALTGAALLTFPRRLGARASGAGKAPREGIVRLLGGRYLVQGVIETAQPTPLVLLASSATDVLHASSMAAAMLRPAYRNAARASLAVAVTSAAAAGFLARSER